MYTPTPKEVEALARHEAVPADLCENILEEILCALTGSQLGWLYAALEGVCRIPGQHRRTHEAADKAARALALGALGLLQLWWDADRRAGLAAKLTGCYDPEKLLRVWVTYRATERHKRKEEAASRQLQAA